MDQIDFSEMQRCCFYILIRSIIHEKSTENLKLIFSMTACFLAETFSDEMTLVIPILRLLTEMITSGCWNNNAILEALTLIDQCSEFIQDESEEVS